MTEEEKKTLSDLFEAMGKTGAQFQIGQVIGSQTNTYHYYGEKGGGVSSAGSAQVPEPLQSEDAKEWMEELVDAGLLDGQWQPKNLSGSERGLVAKAVCELLNINDVWMVFGQLWNEKPETLRSYFNKAMNQTKSLEFQDKLKKILH